MRAAIGLALIITACASPALAKTYSADRFDSSIKVLPGGALEVTETIVFRFADGSFSHVLREIPTRRTDGIEILRASMDDVVLPFGDGTNQVEVSGRSKVRVRWRFPPVSTSVHTFVLTYAVRGVIVQEGDSDVLAWRALPSEHDYRIAASTIEIAFPSTLSSEAAQALSVARVATRRVDGAAVSEMRPVAERGGIEEVVARITATHIRRDGWIEPQMRLPRGSLIAQAPAWQLARAQARALAPRWITAATLILGCGLVLLVGLRMHYDAPTRESGPLVPSATMPSQLAPGLVGPLLSNGRVSLQHAMGTLFSLASRGIISIEERPRGFLGQRSFHIARHRSMGTLSTHEAAVMAVGMGDDKSIEGVPLDSFRNRLMLRARRFNKAVENDLLAAGLLDPDRRHTRDRYVRFSVGILILSGLAIVPAAFAAASQYGGWPFLVPGALAVVSVAGLIFAGATTLLSNEGMRQAVRWRGFRHHLKALASNADERAVPGVETLLPLAVTVGLTAQWAKFLKKHPESVPTWFRALSTDSGSQAFAAFMAAGSGAHDGAGGGGGGGAAGGGSSSAR